MEVEEILKELERLYYCKKHKVMCDHAFDFCGLTDLIISLRRKLKQ